MLYCSLKVNIIITSTSPTSSSKVVNKDAILDIFLRSDDAPSTSDSYIIRWCISNTRQSDITWKRGVQNSNCVTKSVEIKYSLAICLIYSI